MASHRVAFRRAVASGALAALLCVSSGLSWAEQVLKSPKSGVEVQLKSGVGVNAAQNQPFEATLADSLRYDSGTLPAGTTFKGQITKTHESRRFGRPGYVILQVDQAVLPDGRTFDLGPDKFEPRDKKLRHPATYSFPQMVLLQLPYTAVSLAVTLPLRYAAKVDTLVLIPIGLGVRMATGAVVGLFRTRYKNEPVPRKIALGALDGSGIPRIVGFIGKYPEPDYHPGDTVKLYFNPDALESVFQGASAVSLANPVQFQKAALVAP